MRTRIGHAKGLGAAALFAAVVALLCLGEAHGGALKAAAGDVKGAFRNEKAIVRGDTVVITFKLDAPADETYQVSIRLRKRNDPGFSRVLRLVSGDVGEGEFGQKSCRVTWLFRRELSEADLGEEYSFELTCELVESGFPWWVYAGGGAAAVTAGVILFGKKGEGTTQQQQSGLPEPPGYRPVNP